ncbi:MAG: tRNA (guanosine(37)-N1)-methyltransferase TrmD [Fimbriimonas sp.]|nr:tRNA (guanosine(37)-N1)-methyltransferase TrmD [Fimbriimonas sp.]
MPRIDFVTLFPDMVRGALEHSILGRAASAGLVEFRAVSPRDYCYDQHKKVDDTPYGGHPGMLIKAEPVALAIEGLLPPDPTAHAVIFTEPSGIPFKQENAKELAQYEQVVFVCGHYEGIDHRAEETYATHVFSIGDYVLTNGELPALVMADAITRLLPGVLGAAESLEEDSFSGQGLSAPNYTKPPVWRGKEVPEVLRSGDHKKIEEWRRVEGENRTRERRPDLLP